MDDGGRWADEVAETSGATTPHAVRVLCRRPRTPGVPRRNQSDRDQPASRGARRDLPHRCRTQGRRRPEQEGQC